MRRTARTAASTKDNEMAKSVIQGLVVIALQSVARPPLNQVHGENATASFVLGTITDTVKNFIVTGHTEGTFASFDLVLPVLNALVREGFYQSARFALSSISELTQLCIVAKQPILATQGTRTLLHFLAFSIEKTDHAGDLPEAILKEIYAVCHMELKVSPSGTQHRGFDIGMSHPISRALSVSEDTVVGIHSRLVNGISTALAEHDYETWSRLAHVATNLDEELPRNLAELGALAADKDQFILFYLDEAAYNIARQILFLWKKQADFVRGQDADQVHVQTVEEAMRRDHYRRFRNEMEERAQFLVVFFYSRCRGFQEKGIYSDRVLDCYESAVGIASEATVLGAELVAVRVSEMLGHGAIAALKEQGFAAISPVCRFIGRLIETSLIAQTNQNVIVQAAVETTLEGVFKRCIELTVLEKKSIRVITSTTRGVSCSDTFTISCVVIAI